MYTKDSTCGGFLETRNEFLISDKRDEDVNRVFSTNAYDIEQAANVRPMDMRSNWSNNYPVKVSTTTTKEGVTDSDQNLGAVPNVDHERHRKRYRQDSRYAHIPNYAVSPTAYYNEHAQLAKRRKLLEETALQSDAGQMFEAKRRKFIENLDVMERNSDETKFEVFSDVTATPLHEMEPWKRFSEAGDAWNSTGSEGERIRGRFFRPVQPSLHLKPSSEACPEEKEMPVRTSSRVNLTGSRLAKENVADIDYMPAARLPQQQTSDLIMNSEYFKTVSNRKFISDEYSSHLLDSTSPITTTSYLHSSVQPYQRNFSDKLKSDNVYYLRDSISSSADQPPRGNVDSPGGATFQRDFPRVEMPDPRLAFRARSESWHKRGSAEDEKAWSAGMPLRHNEDLRITTLWSVSGQERVGSPKVPPSNMEEIKENVLTDSKPCYRNRYPGENRSGYRLCQESPIAKGEEELTGGEWRTLGKPWQQGFPESSLGKLEHQSAEYVFGNVLDRGPAKYSHPERPSHTDRHVISSTSRGQFVGADVHARDAANRECEMPKKNVRSGNNFTDTTSSRRWTSPPYSDRAFQNGRHVGMNARQTIQRAKSLSPSLMSNVGSGNFGSLESIREYYRTMGRLAKSSSSPNKKGVNNRNCRDERSSGDSRYPETGTNGPIDLSKRVQKREHYDIIQNEPTERSPPSEMSNTRHSPHSLTFGKQTHNDDSPNTGSSIDVENYREKHALSVSLPNSRISSPSPDSHLPPKKRRYPSYEWAAASESKAEGEGNDVGMWAEDGTVKSTGLDVNLSHYRSNNRHFCSAALAMK